MTTKETLYKLLRIAIGNENDLSLPADVSLLKVLDLSEKLGINGLVVSGFQRLVDNGFGYHWPTVTPFNPTVVIPLAAKIPTSI